MTYVNGTTIQDGSVCLSCQCLNEVMPWSNDSDLANCDLGGVPYTTEQSAVARARATELLDNLTGKQFGFKTFRFMPCNECCCDPCGTACGDGCSDCAYYKLKLPHFDACQITRIVVNGA